MLWQIDIKQIVQDGIKKRDGCEAAYKSQNNSCKNVGEVVNSQVNAAERNQRSQNNNGDDDEDVASDNHYRYNRERGCRVSGGEGVVLGFLDNLLVLGELFAGAGSAHKMLDCYLAHKPCNNKRKGDVERCVNLILKEEERNAHQKPHKTACAQSGDDCHYSVVGAIVELLDFFKNHSVHHTKFFDHTKPSK